MLVSCFVLVVDALLVLLDEVDCEEPKDEEYDDEESVVVELFGVFHEL